MDNKPNNSRKITRNKYLGSGYTVLNLESAKKINVETTIDKSTHKHYHAATDPEETGSKPIQIVRSCCNQINADGVTSCKEFKNKLQKFYKQLTLPKVAWIDEGADLSIVDHFVQLEPKESEQPIAREEIFQPVNTTRPIRILIEGQPGFGKTTLATKLTHDWATGKRYIDFKFAYFVPLRELRERSLEDAIVQIGKRCDVQDSIPIFNSHMKNTLLILDGFDEISQQERLGINKILYGQMYSDLTFIVFFRTGTFTLSKEERTQLFGLPNMSENFQDKQITTLGVTSDANKRIFLEKFVMKSRIDNIMKHLSSQWKLFDSPLLLMLLSIIIQQDETLENISTRTQFYKQLFNCILKHSHTKRGHKIASDFDLFGLDSSPNAIQQSVRQFGILSIPNILEYNLQFESNESTKEIYELGFLINHRKLTFLSSRNHYEGLHFSIVEFATAFGFWVDLKLKHFAWIENDLKLMVSHYLQTEGTSLVLPFLVSLMDGELDVLLSLIDSFSVWFSLDFDLTVKLFSECQPDNFSKSKYLRNFIPHYVDLRDHQRCEKTRLELLIHGSKCGKIQRIEIDDRTDSKLFKSEIAPGCQIEISLLDDAFKISGNINDLKTIPYHGSLIELLHFAASSDCEIHYKVNSNTEDFFVLMTEEKVFSKIKFSHLRIEISEELHKNVVIQLLQNDQVRHFYLYIKRKYFHLFDFDEPDSIDFDMSDFSRAAAESKRLTSLNLVNIPIDLYDLTAGGTKKYAWISVYGCGLTCRQPLIFKNCCQQLQCKSIANVEAMDKMEPSIFMPYHDDDYVERLIEKYRKWTDINTIIVIPRLTCARKLNSAFAWNNIQTLNIVQLKETDQKELAACIHNLPITNLVIMHIEVDNLTLFEHMNDLWAAKNYLRLETILLGYLRMIKEFTLKDLIKGLECNHWLKVHFVGERFDLHGYRKHLLPSNLQITHANYVPIRAELGLHPENWSDRNLKVISLISKDSSPFRRKRGESRGKFPELDYIKEDDSEDDWF